MLFTLTRDKTLGSMPLSTLSEAGWSEKDLENLLASRIQDLLREEQLMVIAQERRWKEEADILALDADGRLFIFELKRGESDESNLLQVLRYAQIFGQYTYDNLKYLFQRYRKQQTNLAEEHQKYFERQEPLPKVEFNKEQRFVVVTAGVDLKTLEAIRYWRRKGLPIESITYHVFKHADQYLLDFSAYSPTPDDYLGLVSHEYIVNTNATYMPDAFRDMLTNNKAAAYGSRKTAVDAIQKGDRVFLYHTGVGVIAVGRADDQVRISACGDDPEGEHFVPVKFSLQADPVATPQWCVPAWEINQALGASYRFRRTVFSVEPNMGDTIEELLRKKDVLARQAAERLAGQMDWDKIVKASSPPQAWFDGDEPKPF